MQVSIPKYISFSSLASTYEPVLVSSYSDFVVGCGFCDIFTCDLGSKYNLYEARPLYSKMSQGSYSVDDLRLVKGMD